VLVLDRPGANQRLVQRAIDKEFGPGSCPVPPAVGPLCRVVDPRSPTFDSTPINTATWSAIWVASDQSCGGCDLNDPYTSGTPNQANTPDSSAIAERTDDIAAFFDAGGGIIAGAGADMATGRVSNNIFDPNFGEPIAFSAPNVPYYSFLATSGAANASAPFSLTSIGTGLGLAAADVCNGCGTHNSFGPPPAGSQLKAAERDNNGRFVTLIEDNDPPTASITSGPTPAGGSNRSFTFASNERERPTFQCRVDNAPFGPCSSPWTATNLSDGRHTVNVRAIDLVGNVQPTPTSRSFCVPGTAEVPGNKGDENCDGSVEPFQEVEASIRYRFRFPRGRLTVSALRLSRITRGSSLRVKCRGKGCPFRSKRVRIRRNGATLSRLFKKRGRRVRLRRGARITISITKSGLISKVYLFRVRRGTASLATRCQLPGSSRLRTRCPTLN
jgi:hypothetical protein